ncbi:MAG TPA: chemotaxis protein CheB [Thermoanaerobaculia bacterium]|nr:chemotaxis protein CheB [Thermoanaerobaculia bacterium]
MIAPEHSRGSIEDNGHRSFPVVGVGASAGGLEAFTQFLTALPAQTGMAFVLVQHLDPRHESRLSDLLGKATRMPVLEATHGRKIEPDHVFVIPPNANLAIAGGRLHLTPRGEGRGPHLPVDYLFRSLAEDRQGRAIGVVLSGTGSDGTLGLCEIKAVGGITFAQDEPSAKHAGMPHSAVDSGCVDFILPPEQIAERLSQIGGHPYLSPDRPQEPEKNVDQEFRKILAIVRTRLGVDFSLYRDTTLRRRIMRRMAVHSDRSWAAYTRRLEGDREEVDALYHDLLINVTSFFRDAELFETLKTRVYPELVKDKPPSEPLRVWVPGCSTGQEAYSLAITLLEFFDDKPIRPPIQIFATDLTDQTALDKARAGVYPESIEAEVSPERLRRFFTRQDHAYRIDKSIRDSCVFARQNVAADPPFSHLDMISCRNVLIYLATPLQKRVLPTFHYALNVPGYLVLGTAESIGDHTELFEPVDRGFKIYAKKAIPSRVPPFSGPRGVEPFSVRRYGPAGPVHGDIQREADRLLLGRYAPPGVLVDENLNIVQFRGRTSPYLEAPAGEPTTHLLKMAREGLFLDLRNALAEAAKSHQTVVRRGVRVRSEEFARELSLEVVPVKPFVGGSTCFLVLFHDADAESLPNVGSTLPSERPVEGEKQAEEDREIVRLRQELEATKEYLQSLVEQQDAANEELRAANEEILSSNEELQSTNEELETAKEELQSVNEELTTVNEQLQSRNLELTQANNDLTNLMATTEIPVVMVGGDLRIRRFTPSARKVMNLLSTDVGRPIGDIKPSIEVPDLERLIVDVIESAKPQELETRDRGGRWYNLRVFPYRTKNHDADGAVLVMADIDQFRRNQEELSQRAALLDLSLDAIVVRDADHLVTYWNHGAEAIYGWTPAEAIGQPLASLLHTGAKPWASLNETLDRFGVWEGELRQVRKDGTPLIVHSREVLVRDRSGDRSAVLATKRDVTERKRTLEALREADRRKDEFLATLAHELRNPLAPIANAVEIMRLASDDPEAVAHAREILFVQVRHLSRIVEDLIDVSRIVEQKVQLQRERVALADVVDNAVESCRALIESRDHRLHVTLPAEPLYVDADPVRLHQILINLLNNAAKFTEPGGEIRLSVERRATPGPAAEQVEIRVRDSGIGIAPDLLPRVFEMYMQGESGIEQNRGGLGIGLSLVRALVQMHGGKVEARSDGPHQGSELIVQLPLASLVPLAAGEAKTPSRGTTSPFQATPKRRILVVDDNQDQTRSLKLLLELLGHEVRLAFDGPTGIETAIELVPDVALIDIGLPGASGLEVAQRLRERPELRDTVLIAQTGWGQEEDRRRSKEAGFDHHLVKPIDMTVLQEILAASRN